MNSEFDLFVTDLNGQLRGKRLPADALAQALSGKVKLPLSVAGLDIWGDDVGANGLVYETGDKDARVIPVSETPSPVPWATGERRQLLAYLARPDGSRFGADARSVLMNVLDRYTEKGLVPVVATELEFYLLDGSAEARHRPVPPVTQDGRRIEASECYSMDQLDGLAGVLGDMRSACELQGIEADSILTEYGPGQFEVNLHHQHDAVAVADQSVLFRRLVQGVTRQHGYGATFMAKPYIDRAGNGFHVHVSVLDAEGRNVFDDGSDGGSDVMRHAVGGLLKHTPELMLMLAPHLNSWRRFVKRSHAPRVANWGYDNRMSAVRIPAGTGQNRRIEHRMAGSDANPYLVLAAILAALLDGVEQRIQPPPPSVGEINEDTVEDCCRLPPDWYEATTRFSDSEFAERWFGSEFKRVYVAAKLQEQDRLDGVISNLEYDAYLGRI